MSRYRFAMLILTVMTTPRVETRLKVKVRQAYGCAVPPTLATYAFDARPYSLTET